MPCYFQNFPKRPPNTSTPQSTTPSVYLIPPPRPRFPSLSSAPLPILPFKKHPALRHHSSTTPGGRCNKQKTIAGRAPRTICPRLWCADDGLTDSKCIIAIISDITVTLDVYITSGAAVRAFPARRLAVRAAATPATPAAGVVGGARDSKS